MTTFPAPTAHYMSTLDDQADQIMHTAATILADRLNDGTLTVPENTEGDIDLWYLHEMAMDVYQEIRPHPNPNACIGDTEVRYTVWEVVSERLTNVYGWETW